MHVLAERPLEELRAYEQYTAEHGLPLWRIELQLARLAMLIDTQNAPAGLQVSISDYLIRPKPPESPAPEKASEPPTEAQAAAAANALGFKPQNRRKPNAPPPPPTP